MNEKIKKFAKIIYHKRKEGDTYSVKGKFLDRT